MNSLDIGHWGLVIRRFCLVLGHWAFTIAVVLFAAAPALAADWPHWRGPDRNDIVAEDSGYDAGGWPPRPVWQKSVGEGSTSPLIVGDALYAMGSVGGKDSLWCLDAATGDERWRVSYAAPRYGRNATGDQGLFGGITSTPEYDPATGWIYTLSADGDLNCWDTRSRGRKIWGGNLYDAFRMERRDKIGRSGQRDYGYTTAPLVYNDWLLVEVGGNRGTVMALDKRTGRAVWGSDCKDKAGHTGGLALMTVEGVPCVAVHTLSNLLVVRLDPPNQGKTVALYPWQTEFANNVASPVALGSEVMITSGYNQAAICKLRITLRGAQVVWKQNLHSKICTPVIHKGKVYWVFQQPYCIDFATGRQLWTGPRRFGDAGSCILTGDERLIVWAKRGDLVLAETAERSPGAYKELARVDGMTRDDVWPHVVLCNGLLYVKDRRGNLQCLSVDGRGRSDSAGPAVARTDQDRRPAGHSSPRSPGPGLSSTPALPPVKPIDLASLKSWPGDGPGLVLAWRRGFGRDRIVSTVDKAANRWRLATRDNARLGESGELQTAGGAFVVGGAAKTLLEACRRTNQLSIEVVLSTANTEQFGPARIVSFSVDPYNRNFTLGQDRDQLVLRLRTPQTGENGMRPETKLCSIEAGRWKHVVVTYRDGQLVCYRNGREVSRTSAVRGDFSNWTELHLLLGDEWEDHRHWHGRIERVAVFNRVVSADEVKKRFMLIAGSGS